jgi:ATP-dependent RNA helicase RhlE
VATDIAARGIDVDELTHVINYELPNIPETYVHRIGRTGRAGLSGVALSFCEQEEVPYLKDIQKLIGKKINVDRSHDYHIDLNVETNKNHAPQQNQQKGKSSNNKNRNSNKNKRNFSRQRPQ